MALREEQILRESENKMLKEYLNLREKTTKKMQKIRNKNLSPLYSLPKAVRLN
jgi:hypothetical protein